MAAMEKHAWTMSKLDAYATACIATDGIGCRKRSAAAYVAHT